MPSEVVTYQSIDLAPEATVQVSVIEDLTMRLGVRFPVELSIMASEKKVYKLSY